MSDFIFVWETGVDARRSDEIRCQSSRHDGKTKSLTSVKKHHYSMGRTQLFIPISLLQITVLADHYINLPNKRGNPNLHDIRKDDKLELTPLCASPKEECEASRWKRAEKIR
jgi:hypothetical protein